MNNYIGGTFMDDRSNEAREAPRIIREMRSLAAERKQNMLDLKRNPSIDKIWKYVAWLEENHLVVYSLSQQIDILRNLLGAKNILERDHRALQREVINILLQHLLDEQKKAWLNGTPKEQLNALNLSSKEEEKYQAKLYKFIDLITSDYIKYPVHMRTPSVVAVYLDIDTVLNMIKNTNSEPETSFEQQIANIFIQSPAYQRALPKETISLRDPFGDKRAELTAKNFSPVETDYPKELAQLIEQIKKDRQAPSEQPNISPGLSR
jgi:hypothetical protein